MCILSILETRNPGLRHQEGWILCDAVGESLFYICPLASVGLLRIWGGFFFLVTKASASRGILPVYMSTSKFPLFKSSQANLD